MSQATINPATQVASATASAQPGQILDANGQPVQPQAAAPVQSAAPPAKPAEDPMARMEALKSAFPDASEFVIAQFQAGHNVAEARGEYAVILEEKNKAQAAEIARLTQSATATIGSDPVKMSGAAADDDPAGSSAKEQWDELVASYEKKGMNKTRATSAAWKKAPDLHQSMLTEFNPNHTEQLAQYAASAGR